PLESVEELASRRHPRPYRADQADGLAGPDGERHAVHCMDAPELLAKVGRSQEHRPRGTAARFLEGEVPDLTRSTTNDALARRRGVRVRGIYVHPGAAPDDPD